MRIATEVKGYLTAPPPPDIVYAPYDLALDLSNGLVDAGHRVDFYAPEGSNTGQATLITLGQKALASSYDEYVCRERGILWNTKLHSDNVLALYDQRYSSEMFRRAREGTYDILHFHHPEVALPYVHDYPEIPVIYTMHDPIDTLQRSLLETYQTPNQWLVSISDYQRRNAPDLPYIATVYNGIDTTMFTHDPSVQRGNHLLFAGRIVPEKGAKEAVQVALASGHNLDIIGPVFPDSQAYFDEYIKPYLGNQIRYLGHIRRTDLSKHFQQAKALLMPIQWDEPFGLAPAEFMSTGGAVLALGRGSMPEIVDHEVTGFVVDSLEQMIQAIGRIGEISPEACREHVMRRFSIRSMVAGYKTAYAEAIRRSNHSPTAV